VVHPTIGNASDPSGYASELPSNGPKKNAGNMVFFQDVFTTKPCFSLLVSGEKMGILVFYR